MRSSRAPLCQTRRRNLLNAAKAITFAALLMLQACGGGSSGSGGGSGGGSGNGNPIPTISSIGPNSALAQEVAFTLTVSGRNFVTASTVMWNGSPRSTLFVSNTMLQARTTPSDIAQAGTASVTVFNPAPAGGTSNAEIFTIDNFGPIISDLNPGSSLQGGPSFTITVSGADFVPTSTVQRNGSPRTTSFVSTQELQAEITAADIATAGSASVTAFNPPPGGGTSPPLTFPINPNSGPGFSLSIANQASNDLVWDATNHVIYLSVPSAAVASGNSIATLNPTSAAIVSYQATGSEPDALAIADDSSYLYAGLDGANEVQRFTLPSVAADINYSLGSDTFFGPYFALDLQVAPAASHTTAVTLGLPNSIPAAIGGIVIYDDATPRPTTVPGFIASTHSFDSLLWGADATALYAANNEDTGFDFYTLSVNSTGAVLDNDYFGEFTQFGIRIHFDSGTKLVYSDDGLVVDPSTGSQVGNFNASGLMVPDSGVSAAFFIGQTSSQVGTSSFTIESFDLTDFAATGAITLPNVEGNPLRLVRWGPNGLAFNTDAGQVYLISGTFVSQVQKATSPPSDRVRRTWKMHSGLALNKD